MKQLLIQKHHFTLFFNHNKFSFNKTPNSDDGDLRKIVKQNKWIKLKL